MSRISGSADRPIASKEQISETEQTSETSTIQKPDTEAKTRLNAEQPANEQAPADTKGQVSEHRLDGKARQAELQSKLPIPSTPARNEFPEKRSDLDPNVHLDEKIDVTKNLPDGHAINSGLKGLDWGSSKEKTGPNHMGVDLTYGGMKAPSDRIAEVVDSGKLGQTNTSAPQKRDGEKVYGGGSGNTFQNADEKVSGGVQNSNSGINSEGKGGSKGTPPPGVELGFRAPKGDLVGQTPGEFQTIFGRGPQTSTKTGDVDKETAAKEAAQKDKTVPEKTNKDHEAWLKKTAPDGGTKMTDPDAAGGTGGVATSDEIAKKMKGRLGQVEHGINPDLGVSSGPTGELKKPIDLLSDPADDGKLSFETSTPEKAKLNADIHGPRTVNPDSGFGPPKPDGGVKGGGGDPGGGDPGSGDPNSQGA